MIMLKYIIICYYYINHTKSIGQNISQCIDVFPAFSRVKVKANIEASVAGVTPILLHRPQHEASGICLCDVRVGLAFFDFICSINFNPVIWEVWDLIVNIYIYIYKYEIQYTYAIASYLVQYYVLLSRTSPSIVQMLVQMSLQSWSVSFSKSSKVRPISVQVVRPFKNTLINKYCDFRINSSIIIDFFNCHFEFTWDIS